MDSRVCQNYEMIPIVDKNRIIFVSLLSFAMDPSFAILTSRPYVVCLHFDQLFSQMIHVNFLVEVTFIIIYYYKSMNLLFLCLKSDKKQHFIYSSDFFSIYATDTSDPGPWSQVDSRGIICF